MMNKRILCGMVAIFLILSGCGKKEKEIPTSAPYVETAVPAIETEEKIPGVEDSFFDDDPIPAEAETEPSAESETTTPEETTKPTESTKPTEATEPSETTKPTEATKPQEKPQSSYESFQNMSASQQQAYMDTFDSIDAFFAWYNNAKAEHEAANPPIDVGNGSIDMGELMD